MMKFILLMVIFITVLPELSLGNLRLSQELINYLFPKDLGIERVRSLEQVRIAKNMKILDFVGLVERHGYPAEEHKVVTEDGYELKVHRMPDSPLSNSIQNKKVVFLQHGLIASSDTWVFFGPGKDLAFLLADQGYDVWLGNFRGNTYCRSHVKLSPQDDDFWKFSFHESGYYDLPAMIDYILNYTGQENLLYIGHSMGTTTLFILLSTRPEYNQKINLGLCLAPVTYLKQMTPIMRTITDFGPQILALLDAKGINEILPLTSIRIKTARVLCADGAITQAICVTIMFLFAGSDPPQVNTTALPEIFTYYPAGASVRTIAHFYQNIIADDFRSYDNGSLRDYEQFKQTMKYDLKNVVAPIALFHSNNDPFTPKMRISELYKELPNVVILEEIPYQSFTHLDYLWAIDARSLLYDHVIDTIQKFENKDALIQNST